jgi:transposase
MKTTNYDYTGKKVFVGIDVHKKTYAVVCNCDGRLVKKWTQEADPNQLSEQLKKYFTGAIIKSAYEAGFAGFVLHRVLESFGIENIVVNPASIEIASRDKVKTDKRDALKIAEQLSTNRLKCIYIPTRKEELARLLSRTRASLVKERTAMGQKIKSKLYQFGLITANSTRKISLRWIKELKEIDLPYELKVSIEVFSSMWIEFTKKIQEMNAHLRRQADEQKDLESIYRSVPGIGAISARELANELGDMKRFANEKGLFSYTGLTPYEYSSGETRRLGHITRCGRGRIRKILVEASWFAVRQDALLGDTFNKIANRAGMKRAIVAIARKLIGKIRACFVHGKLYEYKKI